MKAVVLLALIFSFAPPHADKGGKSASPPILPGSYNSRRLEKLFTRVLAGANGFEISFGRLDPRSPYLGRTSYLNNQITIRIRDGLEGELRETALAHELLHAELRTQGYATNYRSFDNDPFLNELSERLIDCVSHQIVYPRMRAAGFKPGLMLQPLAANAEHLSGNLNDVGFQRINGLITFCLSLQVDAATTNKVERAINKVQPAIVEYAHHLRSRFGALPCNDPESCFLQLKKLRDDLGYPQVAFGNPKTNLAE
jgi:hypothetical protein